MSSRRGSSNMRTRASLHPPNVARKRGKQSNFLFLFWCFAILYVMGLIYFVKGKFFICCCDWNLEYNNSQVVLHCNRNWWKSCCRWVWWVTWKTDSDSSAPPLGANSHLLSRRVIWKKVMSCNVLNLVYWCFTCHQSLIGFFTCVNEGNPSVKRH